MEKFKVSFEANNQQLKSIGTKHASDTYADIEATFVLGEKWTDMDSVSAVWWNDFTRVATVLDSQGKCVVPHEVLTRKGCVRVNLVGSIVEGDELITRLTSYSAEAVQVNEKIKLTGSETSEITPSQYEQFVANVKADADRAEAGATASANSADEAEASAHSASESATASANSATSSAQSATASAQSAQNASEIAVEVEVMKNEVELAKDKVLGMRATAETLEAGSDATASYSDGLLTLGIPRGDQGIQGIQGETGATPNLTIGTVETLAPTEDATATITGTAEEPVLNLGIPKGDTGEVSRAELDNAVSDLKSDLSEVYSGNAVEIVVLSSTDFKQGVWFDSSFFDANETKRIGIKVPIAVKQGDKISYNLSSGWGVAFKLFSSYPDGTGQTPVNTTSWLYNSGAYTATADGYVVLNVSHGYDVIAPSDYAENISYKAVEELSFLTQLYKDIRRTLTSADFMQGVWYPSSLFIPTETKRIGIKEPIAVKKDDVINYNFSSGWGVSFKLFANRPDGTGQTAIDEKGWLYNSGSYVAVADGYLVLSVSHGSDVIAPSDYQGEIYYNLDFDGLDRKISAVYGQYEAERSSTDYLINSGFCKSAIKLNLLGALSAVQSFCIYDDNYYSTEGSNLYEQDEDFDLISTTALSLGHGNSMQLGSNGKAYVSGWDDDSVYVVDLTNKVIVDTIALPTTGYTTCAVDDVNKLIYIFQRETYPSTKENYNFIKYDYDNEQIISTKKINRAFGAMQACDFVEGKIIALYGLGTNAVPNGYIILDTNGDIIAEYIIGTFSSAEPEGVFVDRETFDVYISYSSKSVYKLEQI